MPPRRWLLVHSPLLGPSSLDPLARAIELTGDQATLPNLTSCADASDPVERYKALAIEAGRVAAGPDGPIELVIAGHSGAGAHLPSIASALDRPTVLLFVDAVMPPVSGHHRTPARLAARLDELTEDDRLAPWLEWWPPEVMAELLPDPVDRRRLAADQPRLPRSFHRTAVPVPDGWSDGRCCYLQLSPAYQEQREEAEARQWPAAAIDSSHLGPYLEPAAVLDAASELIAATSTSTEQPPGR